MRNRDQLWRYLSDSPLKNRGSVSIEAAMAFPLFLFTMLFFINVCELYTVKAAVFEASVETAEYMAEYAYLTDCFEEADVIDYGMALVRFNEYVDNKALLEKFVLGGSYGVSFLGSSFPDEEGFIDLHVTYFVTVNIPILGSFSHICSEHIKQRAYLGIEGNSDASSGDGSGRIVFIAENAEVYHNSRSCSYLLPDIQSTNLDSAETAGYYACSYCAGDCTDVSGTVYITSEGEAYHTKRTCSRLRRTVSRIELDECNLPECSRCGE